MDPHNFIVNHWKQATDHPSLVVGVIIITFLATWALIDKIYENRIEYLKDRLQYERIVSEINNLSGEDAASEPLMPSPDLVDIIKPVETAAGSSTKFFLPVNGVTVSKFGPKGEGLANDGINLSAPENSPVTAAKDGVVVYSGDLKGFGNTVLIKHDDDWLSSYSHLNEVAVDVGETINAGTPIGTVGKTGGLGKPQLHFEIRKNNVPVNPIPLLREKNESNN